MYRSTGSHASSSGTAPQPKGPEVVMVPSASTLNATAGFQRASKKPPTKRGGVRGAVKERIIKDMLESVAGNYKILICDQAGAQLLSISTRMHELMEHGVTLVEDLALPRQPVRSSAALYFVSPTEESARAIMNDWSLRPLYKEAHIFFTSSAPDRIIQLLASEPKTVEATKSLKDMMLDFDVPETLLFHFNMLGDIPKLYPPEIALSGGRENILGQISRKLMSVFFTFGSGVPVVRYQGTSRLAQQVARQFFEEINMMSTKVPGFRLGEPNADTPILIIVDRSFDAATPLLHERTYQCLLNDLMPLENNMYEQTFVGRTGQEGKRVMPVDEQDPYWCTYRHKFFQTCLEEIPKKLQELIDANPSLASGMNRGASNKLAEAGSAIRALPEFQEKQAKLSMHVDICTKIMSKYTAQKLSEVCETEQDMAVGRRPFKELYDAVHRLAADVSLPILVRLRLILLLAATSNTRELTEAKKLMLLQESGLANEAGRFTGLAFFISRAGQLPQAAMGSSATSNPTGGPVAEKSSLGAAARRSLRLRKLGSGTDEASSSRGASTSSAPKTPGSPTTVTGDPFASQATLVLTAAANDQLSTADFPVFNAAVGQLRGAAPGAPEASAGATRRTLRMGLSRMGDATGSAPGGSGAADKDVNAVLDLGHEGQVSLRTTQRIVLFVIGGATYGEARAAYEVSHATHREIMVGGTSLLSPDGFLTYLSSLS